MGNKESSISSREISLFQKLLLGETIDDSLKRAILHGLMSSSVVAAEKLPAGIKPNSFDESLLFIFAFNTFLASFHFGASIVRYNDEESIS